MADARHILAADMQAALATYRTQIEAAGLPWREPDHVSSSAHWKHQAVHLRLYSDGIVEMSWPHNGWHEWDGVEAWRALLDPWADHVETGDPASPRPSIVSNVSEDARPERSDGNASDPDPTEIPSISNLLTMLQESRQDVRDLKAENERLKIRADGVIPDYIRELIDALADLDCGDNSCAFVRHRTGMRTNGGCTCLIGGRNTANERRVTRALRRLHQMEKRRETAGEEKGDG